MMIKVPEERAPPRRAPDKLRSAIRVGYVGLKAHVRRVLRASEVRLAVDRLDALRRSERVVISPIRNDADRVPYFLHYYRAMGFEHFVFVDNGSTDHLHDLLRGEADVTVFEARGSFKRARYGMDWINTILSRHCVGKWCLHVDTDEFLVFPDCEERGVASLAAQLDAEGRPALNCVMLDMYSDRPVAENDCPPGTSPLSVCSLFDADGYETETDHDFGMAWIKGGVRGRLFFPDVWNGPALNKTPLVKWRAHYAFIHCAHQLWPPAAHGRTRQDGEVPYGALLHFKFLSQFTTKIEEEAERRQHTGEYERYASAAVRGFTVPATPRTAVYRSSRSLSALRMAPRGGMRGGRGGARPAPA